MYCMSKKPKGVRNSYKNILFSVGILLTHKSIYLINNILLKGSVSERLTSNWNCLS